MKFYLQKISLGLNDFFNPGSNLLKDQIIVFIEQHPGKWMAILRNAAGDKDLAVKVLVFYFWNYHNHMRIIFDNMMAQLGRPQLSTREFLTLRQDFLSSVESACHEQGFNSNNLSWEVRRDCWMKSNKVSQLNLSDKDFCSWLVMQLKDKKIFGHVNIHNLKNPFGREEIEALSKTAEGKEYDEYVKFETELHEEIQEKRVEEWMRAMNPKDYDDEGRKIPRPDWW